MARSLDCSRCLSVAEIKDSNSPSLGAVEKLLRAEFGTEPAEVKGSRAHCARQRGGGVGPELDTALPAGRPRGAAPPCAPPPCCGEGVADTLEHTLTQDGCAESTSVPWACSAEGSARIHS